MPNQGEDCYFFFYSTCTKVRIEISKSVLSMISPSKIEEVLFSTLRFQGLFFCTVYYLLSVF